MPIAFDDHSIDRNFLAGTHGDELADAHFLDGHIDFLPVALHVSDLRLEAGELADSVGGAALRAGFEPAAEQDEGDDGRSPFEIGMARSLRQQARRKSRDHGIAIGGAGPERDQGVHVGGPPHQRLQANREDAPPRTRQHRRRQRRRDDHQGLVAEKPMQKIREGWNHVAAHFQHGHWRGEHGGGEEIAASSRRFLCPRRERIGRSRPERAGAVALGAHRFCERCVIDRAFERHDESALGGEIDPHLKHAGKRFQRLLDMGDAGPAGHPLDAEFKPRDARLVALLLHPRDKVGEIGFRRQSEVSALAGEIDPRLQHAGRGFERLFNMGDASAASHAADLHGGGGSGRRGSGFNIHP